MADQRQKTKAEAEAEAEAERLALEAVILQARGVPLHPDQHEALYGTLSNGAG